VTAIVIAWVTAIRITQVTAIVIAWMTARRIFWARPDVAPRATVSGALADGDSARGCACASGPTVLGDPTHHGGGPLAAAPDGEGHRNWRTDEPARDPDLRRSDADEDAMAALRAWRRDMDRLVELVRLHRMGKTGREVARLLGMSPNTERLYRTTLDEAGLLRGAVNELPTLETLEAAVHERVPQKPVPQQTSTVQAWLPRIAELARTPMKPRAIYDRLRLEDPDFSGTYTAVRRAWRAWKKARGVMPEDVAIPVETGAGEVAQVDFGYVGQLWDPETERLRKAWCFVLVLGFSRHLYAQVVFDQRAETWQRLHVEAFMALGGVPRVVVPDNLKAAVVRAAFAVDGPTELHRGYRELARHYGLQIDPAPPRDPEKKGKVEAGVKYVKGNFFAGRQGQDVVEVRRELARWTREIAGTRTHGTTHQQPLVVFESVERARLLPLPHVAWEPVLWKRALVHRDSHVSFEHRLYSVPWRLIGQHLWLRVTPKTVAVYREGERVATHARSGQELRSTLDAHLPQGRVDLRHRSRPYWEERADAVGPETGALARAVFDQDDVLCQLRVVQAIVMHLEKFPRERSEAAARRARFYGNHTYRGVRDILARGLDREPLPTPPPVAQEAARPRFARSPSEMLHPLLEAHHERH
jgi:transposase